MRCTKQLTRQLALLLALVIFTAPLIAQQKTPQRPGQEPVRPAGPPNVSTRAAAEKAAPTIDNLLSADAYKLYGEVKNVGTLATTGSIAELVDPIMKMADPPKEFKALVKFINANSDMLADSRLIFATWRARADVPTAFVAIELATAEDAAKFEPKLNRMLPTILPTPTPSPSPAADKPTTSGQVTGQIKTVPEPGSAEPPKPEPPPFVVTRSGNLVFVTSSQFKFEKLRPADSKSLVEDANFRQAHERFATEPVFVFINVALNELKYQPPKQENLPVVHEPVRADDSKQDNEVSKVPARVSDDADDDENERATAPQVVATVRDQQPTGTLSARVDPPPSATPPLPPVNPMAVMSLLGLLSDGKSEWPDAIGLALSQEADDYVVRSMLIGPQNGKRLLLPFVPQLFAGRSFNPNVAAVLPEETELLLTTSLDLPQTYQGMLAQLEMNKKQQAEQMQKTSGDRFRNNLPTFDPFVEFEKKGGFKIKDELLPALGNELAIAGSINSLGGTGAFGMTVAVPPATKGDADSEEAKAQKKKNEESMPVVLIGIRDREAAKRLMPKVLDGLGVGVANMIASPVRREDTEMVDYAGAFAYAFVGDFLVISTTPTVRHLIDSYLNHQTLSSNSAYRSFTRWQPSGLVGQVYISPALMENYQKMAQGPSQLISAAMRDYLLRLNPTPQPITYAYSNEGFGALHELHLPKALVLASIAATASATKEPPPEMNEAIAGSMVRIIVNAETTWKASQGNGSYGSLDQLIQAKLVPAEQLSKYGYHFQVNSSGTTFEVTATPVEYGKNGKLSYFGDSSGVVRSGDHGGGPATVADKPMQ